MTLQEQLARKFSELLCKEIGRFKVCRVNKRNFNAKVRNSKTEVCHSHDFTDANEVMLAAREELGIEFPDHDDEWKVLSDAWGLAKENQFYLSETLPC